MYEVKIYRPNQDKTLEVVQVISKEEIEDREIAKILQVDEFKTTYRETLYALYQISVGKK